MSNQPKKNKQRVIKKIVMVKNKKKSTIKSKSSKVKKKANKEVLVNKASQKKTPMKKPFSKTEKKTKEKTISSKEINELLVSATTISSLLGETKDVITETDLNIIELEKKKKTYWSDDTELAVIDFLKHDFNYYRCQLEKYFDECSKDKKEIDVEYVNNLQEKCDWASSLNIISKKDKIYKDHIHKPLNRLVENIIFNFKLFRPGIDIKTLQADCLSFVYGKFSNFNPDKNTKSFSFFGTIAKHYLMGEKKDTDKGQQVNLDYDDHKEEADEKEIFDPSEKSDLDKSFNLFSHVIDSIESEIQKKLNNPNEKKSFSDIDLKVADAIISIFKNHELIGAYNKIHIYHQIKEYTGLQTKDITYSLARFRVFYRLLKQDFIKQNIDKD